MRAAALWLLPAVCAAADPTLYLCGAITRNYVVGAKLPPSGLFLRTPAGAVRHLGFNHPYIRMVEFDPHDPSLLYAAAGNGLLRMGRDGEHWKILTGSDVTEIRDVAVDPNQPGAIYFAHSHGIRASRDGGATWREISAGLHRKYCETVRVDRSRVGVLVAGNEEGIFRSPDGGATWQAAGAAGQQILRLEQSPHDPCYWLATTQGGGLFFSTDCARTFEGAGRLGVDRNLYDIAFDPTTPGRIAVAGWGPGVAVTTDNGKTWELRNAGLPRPDVWSVVFDPARAGRLFASVHEEAVYLSDDAGATWRKEALEGSIVTRMQFAPEAAGK